MKIQKSEHYGNLESEEGIEDNDYEEGVKEDNATNIR